VPVEGALLTETLVNWGKEPMGNWGKVQASKKRLFNETAHRKCFAN
jgi:hypothetical protein